MENNEHCRQCAFMCANNFFYSVSPDHSQIVKHYITKTYFTHALISLNQLFFCANGVSEYEL